MPKEVVFKVRIELEYGMETPVGDDGTIQYDEKVLKENLYTHLNNLIENDSLLYEVIPMCAYCGQDCMDNEGCEEWNADEVID